MPRSPPRRARAGRGADGRAAAQHKAEKAAQSKVRREDRAKRNATKMERRRLRATIKIQQNWRSRVWRMGWRQFMHEKKAVVRLQARMRGNYVRLMMQRAMLEQVEEMAITNLQSAFRGHQCRAGLGMTGRRGCGLASRARAPP